MKTAFATCQIPSLQTPLLNSLVQSYLDQFTASFIEEVEQTHSPTIPLEDFGLPFLTEQSVQELSQKAFESFSKQKKPPLDKKTKDLIGQRIFSTFASLLEGLLKDANLDLEKEASKAREIMNTFMQGYKTRGNLSTMIQLETLLN